MPRPHAILQSEFAYNISARCINRDWFDLPLDQVWEILCDELYMATILHELRIHSFILMGNHFHLIASTPRANISQAMGRYMEMTSKRIGEKSHRINRIWGTRHYKTVLGSDAYFKNAYKYNYYNPVKAGIVERCEEYRFSTLGGLLGQSRLLLPMVEDTILFTEPEQTLEWLNRQPPGNHLGAIRAALHKSEFKHVKCPKSRKLILGQDDII